MHWAPCRLSLGFTGWRSASGSPIRTTRHLPGCLLLGRRWHDDVGFRGGTRFSLDRLRLDRFRGHSHPFLPRDPLSAACLAGQHRRRVRAPARLLLQLQLRTEVLGPISLRVLTISLVAAGLYFLSRQAAPSEHYKRVVALFHSFAATGLLAFLAWYEYPNGWLAPIWAAFALVLAIADQRLKLQELPWQSHALAAITLVRAVSVNLYFTLSWHGFSVRLLSLAVVAVIFYALSRLIRMPDEWRQLDLHHVYSWSASVIVSLLLWYELQPVSIAVGWPAVGLLLFESGIPRNTAAFADQGYVPF